MSTNTLAVLAEQHREILGYESRRAARRGRRTPAERAQLERVVAAHALLWEEAGGKARDFLLAGLAGDASNASPEPEQSDEGTSGKARAARRGNRSKADE